jgi:SAM-dependent methyltransferase
MMSLTVFWPDEPFLDIEEVGYCRSFCLKTSKTLCSEPDLKIIWKTYSPETPMSSLFGEVFTEYLLVITDPEIILTFWAVKSLLECSEKSCSVCAPVYNLTEFSQQQAKLKTPYLNIETLKELSRDNYRSRPKTSSSAVAIDPSCIIYPLSLLKKINQHELRKSPIDFSKSNFAKIIVPGSLVHRFGNYYGGERPDLVAMIPDEVSSVLDIGCAMGGYGRGLKKERPGINLTGVEMNPVMAEKARVYYDEIFQGRIEDIDFETKFDLINCGDVIEHLYDPWKMLGELKKHLHKGGCLVLSVPNAGHWTILRDLLQGRFEYVPVGITCITHIRWFTEASITSALVEAGFDIDILERQQLPPTPKGREFIRTMKDAGYGDERSLLTNEFIIRAIKK